MGLQFIHFGFLAAGLAAVLPVLIHLLFRPKVQTIDIGSIRFLEQVLRSHRRRRRIQQWILLTLRTLAVLLLVLLFARPYWPDASASGTNREIVFLIDGSASMQTEVTPGTTLFEQAFGRLRAELAQVPENSIIHLGRVGARGVQPWKLEELSTMKPTQARADWGLAFEWARDRLQGSERSSQQVVVISDMQASGMASVRKGILPDHVECRVLDGSSVRLRNLAVAQAGAKRSEIRPDQPFPLEVVVHNHGPLVARDVEVRCSIIGPDKTKISSSAKQTVPGRQAVTIDLPLDIRRDGLYQGEVEITSDDGMLLDNRHYVAFEARYPERVLLVDGQEGRFTFANETYFLETALGVRMQEAETLDQSFETERIVWERGKGFPRLDGYRAVVLANVRQLTDQDAQRLTDFLRAGGSLLIFAGDQVSRSSLRPLERQGVLPGVVADDSLARQWRVTRWNAKHAAFACFSDAERGDLRQVTADRILPLESLGTGAVMLLQANDRILAAEQTVGSGRCLYFGFTADRDWTELPRTPLYVPLVRQLVAHATGQLANRSRVVRRHVQDETEQAGLSAEPGDEGRRLVLNLDPNESVLERLSPDECLERLGSSIGSDERERQAALALDLPADRMREDEIWRWVAWGLLVVLMAETLAASTLTERSAGRS